MTTPHSTWAEYYDAVYEESFGSFYNALTEATIKQIETILPPPARIVDFGAGTGRLSIPLALMGYEVFAVEPCKEMLDELGRKGGGKNIVIYKELMQDFQAEGQFDLAVCVFTVLAYFLDENALEQSIRSAANALQSGGLFLIDVPSKLLFHSSERNTGKINRQVNITSQGDNIFKYEEETVIFVENNPTSYSDRFLIRYWEVEDVMKVLEKSGFSMQKDLTINFAGSGSQYFLMQKE